MLNNEIIIYRDGELELPVEVGVDKETVWLNRNQLAILFDRDVKTSQWLFFSDQPISHRPMPLSRTSTSPGTVRNCVAAEICSRATRNRSPLTGPPPRLSATMCPKMDPRNRK